MKNGSHLVLGAEGEAGGQGLSLQLDLEVLGISLYSLKVSWKPRKDCNLFVVLGPVAQSIVSLTEP